MPNDTLPDAVVEEMTDLIQRARDMAGRLIAERPADFSGRVRKPAPIQKEAAAIIAELIERIEGKQKLDEWERAEANARLLPKPAVLGKQEGEG